MGFRPFIHKQVRDSGLTGTIKNTSSGVELELEGERETLESFVEELPDRAPVLAVIEHIEAEYFDELRHFTDFRILQSRTESVRNTLISPDIALCDDCRRELLSPGDRRYRYPFINCTNCGPRFTIIKDVPYDRPLTSMGKFPMCPDCDREYHDIEDRRYHAQPDCCPVCGPHVFYLDANGVRQQGDAIALARAAIREGKIIAVKGLGGMHLACRCDDPSIVTRLRHNKQRDEKPFAIMCRDVEAARQLCFVSPAEEKILNGHRKPIVLLRKRREGLEHLSENGFVGVMLPYTPLHVLLFGDDFDALVMTSANLSDTPIMFQNNEATDKLRGIAEGYLLHNRDIQTRCDDSLCWVLDGKEYFARRSRGYVPFPVQVSEVQHRILACGAEQKASFCLSKPGYAFPSQHIGDLKNMETYEHYTAQIAHFERLFDIAPELLVCDRHPDYLSTAYAEERGLPLLRVQHHHAHIAACMADNGLNEKVIGLAWDGTGWGDDGSSWGGECLLADYRGFERVGSLRQIPLIGGDLAVHEIEKLDREVYPRRADFKALAGPFGRVAECEVDVVFIRGKVFPYFGRQILTFSGVVSAFIESDKSVADVRNRISGRGRFRRSLRGRLGCGGNFRRRYLRRGLLRRRLICCGGSCLHVAGRGLLRRLFRRSPGRASTDKRREHQGCQQIQNDLFHFQLSFRFYSVTIISSIVK